MYFRIPGLGSVALALHVSGLGLVALLTPLIKSQTTTRFKLMKAS